MITIKELFDNAYFANIISGAAWDVIKAVWTRITKKPWEDLYWDSFKKAVEQSRPRLMKYVQKDGKIEYNKELFFTTLYQNLKINVKTKTLSGLLNDRAVKEISKALASYQVVSLEGNFLSADDYVQIVRNIVDLARNKFKDFISDPANDAAFRRNLNDELITLQGKMDNAQEINQEIKNFLQNILLDKLDEIHKDIKRIIPPKSQLPPMQKPPRVDYFTGREEELEKVLASIQPGKVVTLCGPGGMGKSALAAEAVWQLSPWNEPPHTFPDGVVRVNFYEKPDTQHTFKHILRSYYDNIREYSANAVQRLLGYKQALLILDGAEEANDIKGVLDACGGQCGIIMTTRKASDAPSIPIILKPLKKEKRIMLLRFWGNKWADDEEAVKEISDLVGGLPMALRLVGSYLTSHKQTAREYLDWLKTSPLVALDQGNRHLQSIPILMKKSIAQVSQEERDVLSVIGMLALDPFTPEVIATSLDIENNDAKKRLGELVNFSMLDRKEDKYVVSHQLVHTYLRTEIKVKNEIIRHLAEYYIEVIKRVCSNNLEGYRVLDGERTHILRVIEEATNVSEWQIVIDLVSEVYEYLSVQGHWMDAIQSLERGVDAARKLGLKNHEGSFLGKLGHIYSYLSDANRAIEYSQQALIISKEIIDPKEEVFALGNLGFAYRNQGFLKRAIEYHKLALNIARENGYRLDEDKQLGYIGIIYRNQGRSNKAMDFFKQALEISREIGNRNQEGLDLGNLGLAYSDLGHMDEAFKCYKPALTILRTVGDRRGESNALGDLGFAYAKKGQIQKAIAFHKSGLDIAEEIGYLRGIGNRKGDLGLDYILLYRSKEEKKCLEEALKYLEEALAIAKEIGDQRAQNRHLGNLGKAYACLGALDIAIKYNNQALSIARKIGERRNEGEHLYQLGEKFAALGNIQNAISNYEEALTIFEEIISPYSENVKTKLLQLRGKE